MEEGGWPPGGARLLSAQGDRPTAALQSESLKSAALGQGALTRACPEAEVRAAAICIRGVRVTYPSSKMTVLNGLDMRVAEGTIYGLLGASGCGKTTLLTCIVGRRRPDEGSVQVLGLTPGSPGSGLPGPTVGYMPQDLALHNLFSVAESFRYFGWVLGMSKEDNKRRMEELITLLGIPGKSTLIGELSGGEQRRVSLGIALQSEAPVLLLDEPTVGVDSTLRQRIWDLLLTEVQTRKTTVIITTHYIEEARQAHKVGLMRDGVILDEDSPSRLLMRHCCQSMEEVLLKLSLLQNKRKMEQKERSDSIAMIDTTNEREREVLPIETDDIVIDDPTLLRSKPVVLQGHSCLIPCTWKMFVYMFRNRSIVAVSALVPLLTCLLFGYGIGGTVTGLHLAVVNDDFHCSEGSPAFPADCEADALRGLSCRYLDIIDKDIVVLDEYGDVGAALSAVQHGQAWGYLYFRANYSRKLQERQREGLRATNDTLENSEISVWLDMSSEHIGNMLKNQLGKTALDFFKDIEKGCEGNISIPALPMSVESIYGKKVLNFRDYYASALLLVLSFGLISQFTMVGFVDGKKDGFLERSLTSGVNILDILGSHVIVDTILMFVVTAEAFLVVCVILQTTNAGSWWLLVTLVVGNGLCGMFLGYSIGAMCSNEYQAIVCYMGVYFPLMIVSGVLWPPEGMHPWVRQSVWVLPQHLGITGARAIMTRGWGLDNDEVLNGFISTFVWLVTFVVLTVACLRRKKRL